MKKVTKRFVALLMAGMACISPIGLNMVSAQSNNLIVFVPKVSGNAFFESANDGAQKIAEESGFEVRYDGNPEASVANQVTIINNAIQQGADAISVSAVDATGLDDVLRSAMEQGITVTTWDSDVSSDARQVMVAQGTPEQLGQMLVEMGVESLIDRGKDPENDEITYAWHYSQATVADQNSWQQFGEEFIKENYPNWVNVAPENYYSNQNAEQAIQVGEAILAAHSDIDLIICNDSTALPGQLQAMQNSGLGKDDVTVTGFASPNSIRDYLEQDVLYRWGLWDVQVQGALAVWISDYLAQGNEFNVGDTVEVPGIGEVELLNNSVLDPNAEDVEDKGVIVLPERVIFDADNVDEYDF
ncbi:substrate-binding domain-containing protein [Fundicoccus culcitae]|uniref:Substrate-binding domain-containing protein n=1 Tax=Fundicoccus culcitae TaxID=2969821 RepID=A0ABY5P4B3_9LACT|nr:substrate-binding domain-containing protein [Fundicoccus culcitae]UUX33546.1 substrate-binding domain-containing protein [Fundicoccus culcitae]